MHKKALIFCHFQSVFKHKAHAGLGPTQSNGGFSLWIFLFHEQFWVQHWNLVRPKLPKKERVLSSSGTHTQSLPCLLGWLHQASFQTEVLILQKHFSLGQKWFLVWHRNPGRQNVPNKNSHNIFFPQIFKINLRHKYRLDYLHQDFNQWFSTSRSFSPESDQQFCIWN